MWTAYSVARPTVSRNVTRAMRVRKVRPRIRDHDPNRAADTFDVGEAAIANYRGEHPAASRSRLFALATALDWDLRRLLRPIRSPQLTVIGVGQVEGADRVVRQHPIFGHQHRGQPLGVFEKQAVMADAEAEHDVKLAAGTLEQLGLPHRVADRLIVCLLYTSPS